MEDHFISRVIQFPHRVWIFLLAALVLLVIGQCLFSGDQLLSHPSTDIAHHFLSSREFGFKEMKQGDFPLWNPFTYGGTPYLGQFQSALLYPFNLLLFLTLPVGQALNWSIALHVFLLGLGSYLWLTGKSLSRPAAFIAAAALMFGAPFFLHIYAGHLSNLCAMAWVPFLFLSIDSWLHKRQSKWILFAASCVALQIYAGHPQYVYYTAIITVLYAIVHSIGRAQALLAVAGLLCVYPLAALLSAAQLWPGIRATAEISRNSGTHYAFASLFSFPPENLVTAIAPWFLGDMTSLPYWGRCYLWEMSAYMGVGILLLALFGAASARKGTLWRPLILLAGAFLLACGRHIPFLYENMYHLAPFYNSFRGTSKFLFFSTFFVAFFAAHGFDRLLQGAQTLRWGVGILVFGLLAATCGLLLASGDTADAWQWAWNKIVSSGESYLPASIFQSQEFAARAKQEAAHSLLVSSFILSLFGIGMTVVRKWRDVLWLIGVGAIVEIASFAHNTVTTFPLSNVFPYSIRETANQLPPDSRVLNLLNADSSLFLQTEGIWGYDPSVTKRYAQLLAYSQGASPEQVTQYLEFNQPSKILELLRCKKIFLSSENGAQVSTLNSDFPRFFLAGTAIMAIGRDAVFSALKEADLHHEVILEETPHPAPAGSSPIGSVTVLERSNHRWLLKVETDRPTLLVNTDTWSRDWQAQGLPGSVQQKYQVLPANYAIRAIPLAAGNHLLELSYWPRGWGIAIAISIVSSLGVLSFWSISQLRALRSSAMRNVNK